MYSRVTTAEAPARNPVARSLALAVLGVALVAAAIMGAVAFVVLAGFFVVGYLVSLAHAWWQRFQARSRTAAAAGRPRATRGAYLDGELEVVEAAVDAAPRGPGGTA